MEAKAAWEAVLGEVRKHIAGKTDVIELMFIALIANGHVLLEGMPGVAKTTMTKALAESINAEFKRIQGTPDLTTGDIIGYTYLDDKTHDVVLKKGPIFTNMLLVDELNRMPQRTIAALLEALEERQVTIAGADETLLLKKPFITYATQNPISVEGTVTLPKVLTDRFLMRVAVNYPSMVEEQEMLRLKETEMKVVTNKVIGLEDILQMQQDVEKVKMPQDVISYVTRIVDATRTDIHVLLGGSPRAEISFMRCGKARALIQGRKRGHDRGRQVPGQAGAEPQDGGQVDGWHRRKRYNRRDSRHSERLLKQKRIRDQEAGLGGGILPLWRSSGLDAELLPFPLPRSHPKPISAATPAAPPIAYFVLVHDSALAAAWASFALASSPPFLRSVSAAVSSLLIRASSSALCFMMFCTNCEFSAETDPAFLAPCAFAVG